MVKIAYEFPEECKVVELACPFVSGEGYNISADGFEVLKALEERCPYADNCSFLREGFELLGAFNVSV